MSRRRAEFEHRTSIFEGAYRAWSGLGGLTPEALETNSVEDLNPITHPLQNDNRCITGKPIKKQAKSTTTTTTTNHSGSDPENDHSHSDDAAPSPENLPPRKVYPYEPLPRSGLAHPFVQAILSPWLGADADTDAIEVGLTTLRTWWQHRRRGESGSAITALGTDRMQGVVERYVHHFFALAHSLVVTEKEQAPRTLMIKMNDLEKRRKKLSKKRHRDDPAHKKLAMSLQAGIVENLNLGMNMGRNPYSTISPTRTRIPTTMSTTPSRERVYELELEPTPIETIYATAKQESYNLPKQVTAQATQSMLSGEAKASNHLSPPPPSHSDAMVYPTEIPSGSGAFGNPTSHPSSSPPPPPPPPTVIPSHLYGNPDKTPVVLVSENGDIQIAMSIDGITCASCVKIVETVLRGCQGNKSPIPGLLDAVADMTLRRVLIKIDQSSNAKRIAFEATRNLNMVGYTANVKEMSTLYNSPRAPQHMNKTDLVLLSEAFLAVGSTHSSEIFNWNLNCSCPDNGVVRDDCARHSQMNKKIFEAFDVREKKVNKFMAGCGQRYGGECTCGEECECKECPVHGRSEGQQKQPRVTESYKAALPQVKPTLRGSCCGGGGTGSGVSGVLKRRLSASEYKMKHDSYGRQSTTSGFGRALSALSALSIDWENMEDFDVNVDHSAHINNHNHEPSIRPPPPQKVSEKDAELIYEGCAMMYGGICNCGPTCVCVGCPIHDKDNAREHHLSAAVTTESPYTFANTEKTIKRPNLRSSILYKKKEYSDQNPPNHGVTFQV